MKSFHNGRNATRDIVIYAFHMTQTASLQSAVLCIAQFIYWLKTWIMSTNNQRIILLFCK